MNKKQEKIKIEPRIKLNYNIDIKDTRQQNWRFGYVIVLLKCRHISSLFAWNKVLWELELHASIAYGMKSLVE